MHSIVNSLQAAAVHQLLDGKDTVFLRFKLGPFEYKREIEPIKPDEKK